MVKQKLIAVVVVAFLATTGCVTNPPEADFLREERKHMIESIRPALVDALNRAQKPDGTPLYIDPYRDEKVNLLDEMIRGSARIAPTDEDGGKYEPEPLPWRSH